MKKTILIVALTLFLSTFAFSLEESWMSMGFVYGNFFNTNQNSLSPTEGGFVASPGISMNSYAFWDKKNIGLFFYYAGLFPTIINTKDEITNYHSVQLEAIIGPGFRYRITDRLSLVYGAGFDFLMDGADYYVQTDTARQYSALGVNLGIGGDVGLKFDISNALLINVGTSLSYNFVNYTLISSPGNDTTKWAINSLFGLKPYIAIGFNLYNENAHWGKPKY